MFECNDDESRRAVIKFQLYKIVCEKVLFRSLQSQPQTCTSTINRLALVREELFK